MINDIWIVRVVKRPGYNTSPKQTGPSTYRKTRRVHKKMIHKALELTDSLYFDYRKYVSTLYSWLFFVSYMLKAVQVTYNWLHQRHLVLIGELNQLHHIFLFFYSYEIMIWQSSRKSFFYNNHFCISSFLLISNIYMIFKKL